MSDVITVLICGVGGQGTILAADILAKVAMKSGLDVKLSEIHGMSQRGGSVNTIVRFGELVHSPVTDHGYASFIVSFESTEALRYIPYLNESGKILVSEEIINPLPVQTGLEKMPTDTHEFLSKIGANLIDAKRAALMAGSSKAVNMVLLGALAKYLPFEVDTWKSVIEGRVPAKTIESNLKAFDLGYES